MKKYKKYKVKLWDDLYVPTFDLHVDVVLYKDIELLKKWLIEIKTCDDCLGEHKDSSFTGMMMVLTSSHFVILLDQNEFNISTVVHEVTHVRQSIFKIIDFYKDCKDSYTLYEAEAYFEGELVYQVYNRVKKYEKSRPILLTNYKIQDDE